MRQEFSTFATARQLTYPEVTKRVQNTRVKKVGKAKSPRLLPGEKFLYLGSILVCVSLSLLVLSRYCIATELNVGISSQSKEIQQLKKDNQYLEVQTHNLQSSDNIRKFAESKGLVLESSEMIVIQPQ